MDRKRAMEAKTKQKSKLLRAIVNIKKKITNIT